MKLPSVLISSRTKEREVFYFATTKINSTQPHYFICIKKSPNEVLIFTCCTTQMEKREQYFKLKGYSLKSLVHITPSPDNGLDEDTWVDCNSYFEFTVEEINEMFQKDKIAYKGEISDIDYEQILIGLHASDEIEAYVKERFPNPDDII